MIVLFKRVVLLSFIFLVGIRVGAAQTTSTVLPNQGGGDEECWDDVDDPPTCKDVANPNESECDPVCESVVADEQDPNEEGVEYEWVCKNTKTYLLLLEDHEIPEVEPVAQEAWGNEDKTDVTTNCLQRYDCECEDIGGWTCHGVNFTNPGPKSSPHAGEKATGDACFGEIAPTVVSPVVVGVN